MPVTRAASVRDIPSSTSAIASRRRAWSLSFDRRAATRTSADESSLRVTVSAMAILLANQSP